MLLGQAFVNLSLLLARQESSLDRIVNPALS